MMAKRWLAIIYIIAASISCAAQTPHIASIKVMEWNVENLFDTRDDEGKEDEAFTPEGEYRWTRNRYWRKLTDISKVIAATSETDGMLPDLIGLCEVENDSVLHDLTTRSPLRNLYYNYVMTDSPDRRGIDVALLYRKSVFDTLSVNLRKLYDADGTPLRTRGILCVTMARKPDGEIIHFLVNHHPSKYGGAAASAGRRTLAAGTLRHIADSLGGEIVAMGDFNDTPGNPLYDTLSGPLTSKATDLYRAGRGSIRFDGKWELIDLFFTSPDLPCEMDIVEIPFLMTDDRTNAGRKPLRTYSGPRYTGGVSDHLPVILEIRSCKK